MTNVVQIKDLMTTQLAVHTIKDFAEEAGLNSRSTYQAYYNDALQFIKIIFRNNNITTDALANSINRANVVEYRGYLMNELNLQGSTIKRKLSSLRELSTYLYSLGYKIDLNLFKSLQKIKSNTNSYEVLSIEEARVIINWIKNNEKHDALSKYHYCQLAFDTAIRAEAINKLTKSSFIVKSDEVIITGVDKGNKTFKKSISLEFYNELHKDLNFNCLSFNERIFNHTAKNRSDMINRAKKALGWENRNITFHSFKKGAVTHAYNTNKDIQLARKVGGHVSLNTTQTYLADSEEIFQGAISNEKSIDSDNVQFDNFSKEELVAALNQINESTQIVVKKELIKINR